MRPQLTNTDNMLKKRPTVYCPYRLKFKNFIKKALSKRVAQNSFVACFSFGVNGV